MKKRLCLLLICLLLLFAAPVYALDEAPGSPAEISVMPDADKDAALASTLVSVYSIYADGITFAEDAGAEEIIASLHEKDKWARYYTPEAYAAYKEELDGEKCGIGIYFELIDGAVVISDLVKGASAEAAGIRPADAIISVDGIMISAMKDTSAVQAAFAGAEGTYVNIVLRRNGEEIPMTLQRKPFLLTSVSWSVFEDGIAYVKVSSFTRQTGSELQNAYYEMMAQGAKALIIDLCDCPGGVIDGAVEAIDLLVGSDPSLILEYKNSMSLFPGSGKPQITLPLALLVNENTASAAELLAASIQDEQRGLIIGTQTFGKGVMQNVWELPSGAGIVFTTAKYYTRKWQDVSEQGGVLPDIYVADAAAGLQKAQQILNRQMRAAQSIVFTPGSAIVSCSGMQRSFANAPFARYGVSYFPLRETLETLGFEVFWREGCVYISDNMTKCVLDAANSVAVKNRLSVPVRLVLQDDVTYVDSAFLRDMLGLKVEWNPRSNNIVIYK